MKNKIWEIFFITYILLITIIIFTPYLFEHKIPLNGNLLVSFYAPWSSYKLGGYDVGPPAKPIGSDALRIYYPTRFLVTEQIKNKIPPLWNPNQFSGNVLLATFQAAVFFPLGVLFLILPQIDAWAIIIMLLPILGFLFMYLFLKQILKDKRAIFFGAITFAFSGMLMCWWEEMFMAAYSVILLPFILYGIEKVYKKQDWRSFLISVLSAIFSLSTGWFQMIFYSWIVAFFWIIYRFIHIKNKKTLFLIFLSFITALLISAIHLLPSIEAFMHSSRSAADVKADFEEYLVPVFNLISYVAPDFFGNPAFHNYFGRGFYHESVLSIGIIGLIFALNELFSFAKKGIYSTFFKIAWIISLSLGLSLPTSWWLLYTLKIPLISTLVPSRIFFVSAFCVSVLAAFGMQKYLKTNQKKQFVFAALIVLIFFAVALLHAINREKPDPIDIVRGWTSIRNLILPAVFFVSAVAVLIITFFKEKFKSLAFFIFIAITTVGILFSTQKYLYFSQKDFIFPKVPVIEKLQKLSGINRFLGVGEAYIDRNFAMYYGLYSPEGYDSFNNKRYSELVYSSHTKGEYSEKMPRADVQIMKSPNLKDSFENPYRKRIMSLLGVRYLVEKRGENDYAKLLTSENAQLKLIWSDSAFNIYENNQALPRAFIVYDYKIVKDKQKILDEIYSSQANLINTVIIEDAPNLRIEKKGKSKVKIISYKPSSIELQANSTENGILLLTDNYYPGWNAYVNGNKTQILRADYTFRAVAISKGTSKIEYIYKPDSFKIGLYLSALGILIVLVIAFIPNIFFFKSIKYNK